MKKFFASILLATFCILTGYAGVAPVQMNPYTTNLVTAADAYARTAVASITNGLATTNYVNAATNGFVTSAVTNGLATTNYAKSVTNNFTAIVYSNPAAYRLIGNTNFPGIYVTNNAIVGGSIGVGGNIPLYFGLDVASLGNSYGTLGLGAANDISITPNANLILSPVGNVGVGTTTPRGKLDVVNTVSYSVGDSAYDGSSFSYGSGYYNAYENGFSYNVYAYKDTPNGRVYSANPADEGPGSDDGSGEPFFIYLFWSGVSGADGYRILVVQDGYWGAYGDFYLDVPNTQNAAIIGQDDIAYESYSAQYYSYGNTVTPSTIISTNQFYLNGNDNTIISSASSTKYNPDVSGASITTWPAAAGHLGIARVGPAVIGAYAGIYANYAFFGHETPLTNDALALYTLLAGNDGQTYLNAGGSGTINFRINNADVAHIANNGNFGIATTSPSYMLDVSGTFRATGASKFDSTLTVAGAATNSSSLSLGGNVYVDYALNVSIPPATVTNMAYYAFDSSGALLTDSGVSGLTLSPGLSPYAYSTNSPVIAGAGALFNPGNANGGIVKRASFPSLGSQFSISFWINRSGSSPYGSCDFIAGDGGSTSYFSIGQDNSSGIISLGGQGVSGSSLSISSPSGYLSSGWHHIVGVYNKSLLQLYIDNSLVASGNLPAPMNWTSSTFTIGGNNYGYPFYGTMDEVSVWRGALTAPQVSLLYNGAAGYGYSSSTNFVTSIGSTSTLYMLNQKVGINTNSPTYALDVVGTIRGINFIGNGAGLTNITGVSTNFATTSNPTNAYAAGTLYTNLTGKKALLIGSFVQTGASASLIINYTNGGIGYQLPMAVVASAAVNIPFTVPLSPNATFKCTAAVGYMTNTVLWSY